jgi:hypothetical protein
MRSLMVMLTTLAMLGCAKAQLTAFRDPAFPQTRFDRLAVFAIGMELANAVEVERQVCSRITPSPCVQGKSILPPTRAYSAGEVTDFLGRAGVDGVLIIALVGDQSDSRYLGAISSTTGQSTTSSSGSVNLYGNSALWNGSTQTTASAQSVSTPVYNNKRIAFAQVGIFERTTGKIAWRGELKLSGQGEYNISDKVFIKSGAKRLAEELRANGLVR